MTFNAEAIATWYVATTQALAKLKLEVEEAKRLGTRDRDVKMVQLAAGQVGRSHRFNELVAGPEAARGVIAELALKLAVDSADVARTASALLQSGDSAGAALLMTRHKMINPDDDLASLLARAAEEKVTAYGWSPRDGLGEEIEATISEIVEHYNVSLLARSLADTIVGREMARIND